MAARSPHLELPAWSSHAFLLSQPSFSPHTPPNLLAYNLHMTQRSLDLLEQALSLTEEERADLVASLLNSLDASPDPDAESLWQQEVSRRASDLDSGKTNTIPWQ